MNAVGRLSSLYLFEIKGAPTGANGRIDCFKFEASRGATVEDDFEQVRSAFSVDLLSGVASDGGDDTVLLGSTGLEFSTLPELETVPPPFGLFIA